jgi:hypothetical protein
MENKQKYILLILKERNGEYEYRHKVLLTIPDKDEESIENIIDEYIKTFYMGESVSADDGYYFHNRVIHVQQEQCHSLKYEHYQILNNYL